MDFSKLSSNDKLAVYGAVAAIVGPLFSFGSGWLTLILAIAMLIIVFLPQLSPATSLPGSKGSLMLVVGGLAALSALFAFIGGFGLLGFLSGLGLGNPLILIGWLIGIAGGLLMGWAGWQEFQAEGGKFQLGTTTAAGAGTTAAPAEPAPRVDAAPAAPATPATTTEEPAASYSSEAPSYATDTPAAPASDEDDEQRPTS